MTVTLGNALFAHRQLLGSQYENLGRKKWIYLSHDEKKGWSVVHFKGCIGYIKAFLRWTGFFYRSTQIKAVARQIQKEIEVPPSLLSKINACWARRGGGPTELLPVDLFSTTNYGTNIQFAKGDILQPGTEAIVNAANETCLGGSGIDGIIHKAAGPQLLEACRRLPVVRCSGQREIRCETGIAVTTGAYNLQRVGVKHIIHAVAPRYVENRREEWAQRLRETYWNILAAAAEANIRTLAIPAIGTGIFCGPFEEATEIAYWTIRDYILANKGRFDLIRLLFTNDRVPEVHNVIAKIQATNL